MIKYRHPLGKTYRDRVLQVNIEFDTETQKEQIHFFTLDEVHIDGCKGTMLDRAQVEHLVNKLSAWLKGEKDKTGEIIGSKL